MSALQGGKSGLVASCPLATLGNSLNIVWHNRFNVVKSVGGSGGRRERMPGQSPRMTAAIVILSRHTTGGINLSM